MRLLVVSRCNSRLPRLGRYDCVPQFLLLLYQEFGKSCNTQSVSHCDVFNTLRMIRAIAIKIDHT